MTLANPKKRLLQQKLARAGLQNGSSSASRLQRRAQVGPMPLSSAQQRMWYQAQLADGAAYNFCIVIRVAGAGAAPVLTQAQLATSLSAVALRHDILRTRYVQGADGSLQQVVEPDLWPEVTIHELTGVDPEAALDALARAERDRAFDLTREAALRAVLVQHDGGTYALVLCLPHIAGDGGSFGTLLRDIERSLTGELPVGEAAGDNPAALRYGDYAIWEQERLAEGHLSRDQLDYWAARLSDLPQGAGVPLDQPRPTVPSFNGAQHRQWLDETLSAQLREGARDRGISPLVMMQTAVAAVLSRTGAGDDICLGVPVDLRQDPALAQTVGFFTNTVVLRADLSGNPSLDMLLQHVNEAMLEALDHRDVPFEQVVERLNPRREANRTPLFDVMVTTSRPWPEMRFAGRGWQVAEPRQTQAKFDLTFVLHDEGAAGRIGLSVLYASDLFSARGSEDLLSMVAATLCLMLHHPELSVSKLGDLSATPLSAPGLVVLRGLAPAMAGTGRREIALRSEVTGTEIAAALIRLLSRYPALRVRLSEVGPQVMTAAEQLAYPLFAAMPPEVPVADRFQAWLAGPGRLVLSAPAACVDAESWAVLLSDLADLRQGGQVRPPIATVSYDHWLSQTAELAQSDRALDLAEAWLDHLEQPGIEPPRATADPACTATVEIEVPALADWPEAISLRAHVVAALLPALTAAAGPCRLDIDEPDRDRTPSPGAGAALVGCCRRLLPVVIPPQDGHKATDAEALLHRAAQALRLGNKVALSGDVAASFQLVRDIHPETDGTFEGLPAAQHRLVIRLGDWGDQDEDTPLHPVTNGELYDREADVWYLDICLYRKRARLSLRARQPQAEVKARLAIWQRYLSQLLAKMVAVPLALEGAIDEGQVRLEVWQQRKLEARFGPLRAVFALSPLQQGLRFHAVGVKAGEQDVYISQTRLSLHGDIDPARLHAAIRRAAELVPNITAGFSEVDGIMVQVCPARSDIPFRAVQVSTPQEAQALADAEYDATFDAAHPPLLRFALARSGDAATHLLYLTAHHILLDGWSIRLLFRLIFDLYDAPQSVTPPPGFGRYLDWLEVQDDSSTEAPWREILSGVSPTLLYPAAQGLEASVSQSAECEAHISPEDMAALQDLARRGATTLSSVLEMAWGALLMRMSGTSDVVFGNVVSGRPAEIAGVDQIIGLMFNTVPMRVQAHGGRTVLEVLGALHGQKAASLRHSHVQLSRLMQITGHSVLFDTLFAVQNLPELDRNAEASLRFGSATVRDATHYPLSMAVSPGAEGITLRLMYRRDIVSPAHAEALLAAYQHLTAAFAAAPQRPLLQVDAVVPCPALLPSSDAGADLDFGTASVADLLVAQAEKTPELRAVVAGEVELSFAELAGQANQLAHLLRARGVYPEHSVALLLPRSEVMIVALFAVFSAHAAYVPIDAETPARRIEAILDQAEPTVILTTAAMRDLLPESYSGDYRVVEIDSVESQAALAAQPETRPEVHRPGGLDHLAYVIFTSGSTGQPKGVAVPYRGLSNMFVNHQKEIIAPTLASQGGRRIRIAHTTSFAFDASWEQLLWLLSGHEVHVISDELRRDPDRLLDLFDAAEIDAFDVTPTYGSYLVEHGLLERPRPRGQAGTGVVFVSLGGEAVGDALWTQLREAPGVGGYNLYGPTEYTINALGADLAESDTPSVGHPIANTRAMILTPGLLPAPIGVTGELYLSGVGLARGYVQRPGLTAERFVAHPTGAPGERLYRTGDLARWRADGRIDFLGRADNQLKIRGYRIEPAEIENVIVAVPGISRAAVVGRVAGSGELQLVAYVVGTEQAPALDDLRSHLRSELPSYMVPAALVYMADLPRNQNGKLDVAALPDPEEATSEAACTLPETELEARICAAFAQVLDRSEVGLFEDFFEAGGHSLLTVRLVGLLRDSLETEISVRQIYDHPNPAALAAALEPSAAAQDQAEDQAEVELLRQMQAEAVLPTDLPRPPAAQPDLSGARPLFLTGAAGFLGAHVLAELLTTTALAVECMVRAADDETARQRLRAAMQDYGLWQERFADRLTVFAGDLSQERFGLDVEAFQALANRYGLILHNAGATNEAAPYTHLAPTNVGGAVQILRLATLGARAVPVHFVSTASVISRRGENPATISEDTRLTAAEVETNGYVRSKWVAEEIMHGAIAAGLPVTILRPGRVSGHSLSGACGPGVGFWYFIRAMLQLGAAPRLRADQLTLAPVDYVARAMVALLERGEAGTTYHLSNRSRISISAIVEALGRAGYSLEELPFETWLDRLRQRAQDLAARGDTALAPALLLTDHMQKYDGPVTESALGQDRIEAALAGTGIIPPEISAEILDRYIAYFCESGFFSAPEGCAV